MSNTWVTQKTRVSMKMRWQPSTSHKSSYQHHHQASGLYSLQTSSKTHPLPITRHMEQKKKTYILDWILISQPKERTVATSHTSTPNCYLELAKVLTPPPTANITTQSIFLEKHKVNEKKYDKLCIYNRSIPDHPNKWNVGISTAKGTDEHH